MRTGMAARVCLAATLASAALLCGLSVRGQSPRSDSYKLTSLKFNGLSRFNEAQLATLTHLKVGQKVTTDQLLDAQKQLSKSGVFEEVVYSFKTLGTDLSASYDLTESKNMLPCVYDNFVWFSSDEIDKNLRASVTLYTGLVPQSGTTLKDVADALQALARTKAPAATVEYVPLAKALGQPPSAMQFRISGVSMPLQSVTFMGGSSVPEKVLEGAMSDAFGQDFSITRLSETASNGLAPLFRNKGYWRVKFGDPTPMMNANATGSGSSLPVGAAFTIDQGLQFNWAKAVWTGNHAFTVEELNKVLNMQPNELANEYKIDAGLNTIRVNYLTHGYIESLVTKTAVLDDASRMATFDVSIEEGPQYHMGTVQFLGVPPRAAEAIAKKWTLKPGDVFDPTYSQTFISTVAGHELAAQGMHAVRVSTRQQTDRQAHVVSVTLVFQ